MPMMRVERGCFDDVVGDGPKVVDFHDPAGRQGTLVAGKPCAAYGKEGVGMLGCSQEIADEAGEDIRLFHWKGVRCPRNDRELTFRQGFVQRDRVGQCDEVIVTDYDEHRSGDRSM
ncbi:UNVERIFIED_ORG: hypothetical protein ABID57_002235 [Arthrobacter sp. UYEF1]